MIGRKLIKRITRGNNMNKEQAIIVCNQCGKRIPFENGILREDCLSITKNWGYFSKRDGLTHSFKICENCYDKLIKGFEVPVFESETKELL